MIDRWLLSRQLHESQVKERDEYLEYIYGGDFKDDRFYAMLPKPEDGAYRPDAGDTDEKSRREAVMKQLLDDDALTNGTSAVSGQAKEGITTPTPVPMNASLGGAFDGGGEVPPQSTPPGGPPPAAPSGGSEEFVPEPPPPPEPPMEPAPPID